MEDIRNLTAETMDVLRELLKLKSVLLLVFSTLLLYLLWTWLGKIFRRQNYPPGPRAWGTSWRILKASWDGTMPLLASEWAREYGEICLAFIGNQSLVFLNSASVVRRLLASDKYKYLTADRYPNASTRVMQVYGKDLLFSMFDDIMRKKRRLLFQVLNLFGDGVAKFENVVWGELERMFTEIDSSQGKDTDITTILVRSLKIVLYILAVGERPGDPDTPDALEDYDMAINRLSKADVDFVLDYLPFLTRIPSKFKRAVDEVKAAKVKADELIYHSQKRTHIPGKPRGITDLILDQCKQPGYEWLEEDEEHTIGFMTTLFMAAHLTSRASLNGTFLCLLNYPEVTQRIQGEVDSVIGSDRPRMEHKSRMPYTEAAILEGLRLIAQVPLSGFRRAARDFEFEGMLIPQHSLIFMNNWFYLHDEKVWHDPWTFKPDRFLDSAGNLLPADHPRRKELVAFGLGPRSCPGEIFAKTRIFLFVTSILQRYDILPPVDQKLPPADFQVYDESVQGLTRQMPPFRCRLVRRKTSF